MHCELDDLWRLTQEPALHARWDLRFSSIAYIGDGTPQRLQMEYYVTGYRARPDAGS